MVMFEDDDVVVPRISELFGFYKPGQTSETQNLYESPLYQEDWIGLKALNESGRLVSLSVAGNHLQFNESWFDTEIVDKYLT